MQIRVLQDKSGDSLPSGKFPGTWNAYLITINVGGGATRQIRTRLGARGWVKVSVTVSETGDVCATMDNADY